MTRPSVTGIIIQTPRLALRPANQSDEAFFDELKRRPEVAEFIGSIGVPDTHADWVFTILENNERVGVVGIVKSGALDGTDVELICALLEPAEDGGRAKEACEAVKAWAASTGRCTRLLACVDDPNKRSQKLTTRLGFTWLRRRSHRNQDVFVLPLGR